MFVSAKNDSKLIKLIPIKLHRFTSDQSVILKKGGKNTQWTRAGTLITFYKSDYDYTQVNE